MVYKYFDMYTLLGMISNRHICTCRKKINYLQSLQFFVFSVCSLTSNKLFVIEESDI